LYYFWGKNGDSFGIESRLIARVVRERELFFAEGAEFLIPGNQKILKLGSRSQKILDPRQLLLLIETLVHQLGVNIN